MKIGFWKAIIKIVAVFILFQSCKTENKLGSLVYFNQPGDSLLAATVKVNDPVIQPGDRISIIVSALDPTSVAAFNLGSTTSTNGPIATGYVVENDGTITFPQLGKVKVAGITRKELVDLLTSRLAVYITNPIVTAQFLNFKISVLGEVSRPGTINIPDGRVTIIEALGLAGDLTNYSRRDNIMVIREKDGRREFGSVNLLSRNIFSSPYFNLQQNDVIYVELTKGKIPDDDQSLVRKLAITTSIVSVITTVAFLIINLTK